MAAGNNHPAGRARRGRIILLLADGVPISAIATTVGISRRFVYKWVQRFLEKGVEGLADKPGRGSHVCRACLPWRGSMTSAHEATTQTWWNMAEGYKLSEWLPSATQGAV